MSAPDVRVATRLGPHRFGSTVPTRHPPTGSRPERARTFVCVRLCARKAALGMLSMALVAALAACSLLACASASAATRPLVRRARHTNARHASIRRHRLRLVLCARNSSSRSGAARRRRIRGHRAARRRAYCLERRASRRHQLTRHHRKSRHDGTSIQKPPVSKHRAPGAVGPATPANGSEEVAKTSATCVGAALTPTQGNLATVRNATLCLINREREAYGESPLEFNEALQYAAQGHSESMALADYFEHTSPGGDTVLERLRDAGYIGEGEIAYEVGENIAYGSMLDATPAAIVAAWMASPGHRANILNADFRDTGIGISPHLPSSFGDGQSGAMYTQDFGVVV